MGEKRTFADHEILDAIEKWKDADSICENLGCKKWTLQNRLGKLMMQSGKVIDVPGLYTSDKKPITLGKSGIQIGKGHLTEAEFELGQAFELKLTKTGITLKAV